MSNADAVSENTNTLDRCTICFLFAVSEFLKFLAEVDDLLLPILVPLLSGKQTIGPGRSCTSSTFLI